ncbi:MAG TPA: cytochrome c oxidase assembly protein [Acidothermaceae bacterium]
MPADDIAPLTTHTAFTQWEFAPIVSVGVVVVALAYVLGVVVVRRRHPLGPWPVRWTASFLSGCAVIVIATQSSIGAYDDVLFWIHMVQHVLLLMVAPPLLLLGRPVTLLLHATRNPAHSAVKRFVRSRVVNAVTFPLLGVVLYIATVVGTHLTGFMNLTLQHPVAHDLEHVVYIVVGYLYFLPLIGREPIKWRLSFTTRLFLLVLAMPVDTFTGVVLTQANHELFPAYVGRRNWGPSLVADLHAGGAVMWIGGDFVMLVMLLVLFAGAARSRQSLDGGAWIEAARANSLSDRGALTTGPGSGPSQVDDNDAQLAAYNAYLATLGDEHDVNGTPHATKSHDAR